jgi:opacity protein-like surface antigen
MKKTLTALALATAAITASATTVGIDYSYIRATGGSYLAGHTTVVSVEQNFSFGNAKVLLGQQQAVTSTRDNSTIFGLEYSKDFATYGGTISPEVRWMRTSGENYGSIGAKYRYAVSDSARLVAGVGHTRNFNESPRYRATSAGLGAELDLTKSVTLQGGYAYTRLHTLERDANTVTLGVEVKF